MGETASNEESNREQDPVDPDLGLEVDGVSVSFGGLRALDSVSLAVRPGEIVGIIGPNGAGKTTLFNAICGFIRPSSGTIRYRGRLLHRVQPHRLAEMGVARTLQALGLWNGLTVLENVMAGATASARAGILPALLGLPASDRDEAALHARARAILDDLQIGDTAGRYPGMLPFGTQKRVALARALAAEPSLLLLDEPASGLSGIEMAELGDLLRRLRARMAIALVEHHMDLVMTVCDRVVVLDFGKVIASGSPEAVKGDPVVTSAYLGEEVSAPGA
ncbi:MAG: ABC transporter ATP-binding protein [Actinomycetota bacterium]